MKLSSKLKISCALLASFYSMAAANAATINPVQCLGSKGSGYVLRVLLNDPWTASAADGTFSVEVVFPNDPAGLSYQTFTTSGYTSVTSAEGRAIMLIAHAALASGAAVKIYVQGSSPCAVGLNNRIANLAGIEIYQ